jgi:hypothetical protein
VLYITYRKSLATAIFTELKSHNIDNIVHYTEGIYSQAQKMTIGPFEPSFLDHATVCVCQLESIGKVMHHAWDIIITDEVQGLSAQFDSPTMIKSNPAKTWNSLKQLYQTIPTALFMDADFESWTIRAQDFVKTMRQKYTYVVHTDKPKQRKYIDCGTQTLLLEKIKEALDEGLKVFVASNTQAFINKVINQVPIAFETRGFHGGKPLTGDMDINAIASTLDLLAISSGSIGSGVSIEDKLMKLENPDARPFDVCFAYGMACKQAAGIREWYQSLARPRNIQRGLYLYAIKDNHDSFQHDNYKNVHAEVQALASQRKVLYHNRQVSAATAAEGFKMESLTNAYCMEFCQTNPYIAEKNNFDVGLFQSRGLIPGPDFIRNIMHCQFEHIESTRYWRQLFLARTLNDGHLHFNLEPSKEKEKPQKRNKQEELDKQIKAIMEAVPQEKPDKTKWSQWDVSDEVKIKTFIVHIFYLDPLKTQPNPGCVPYTLEYNREHKETLNKEHNKKLYDLIASNTTFEAILSKESFMYRFLTMKQLETKLGRLKNTRALHGGVPIQPVELHIAFQKAFETVFVKPVRLISQTYPDGTWAYFEPTDKAAMLVQVEEADNLVGSVGHVYTNRKKDDELGTVGKGKTPWNGKTKALIRWFVEKGVQPCLVRSREQNPATKKKAQAWILDEKQVVTGLEYAAMMGQTLTKEHERVRAHNFDLFCDHTSSVLYSV